MKCIIPDYKTLEPEHIVFDFNGTLAQNGNLEHGVAERLHKLSKSGYQLHVITSDTNGSVRTQMKDLPIAIRIANPSSAAQEKADLIRRLGAARCIAIGNGRNDLQMLQSAALSFCILGSEGCYGATLAAADLIFPGICDALDSLLEPKRLIASLRG